MQPVRPDRVNIIRLAASPFCAAYYTTARQTRGNYAPSWASFASTSPFNKRIVRAALESPGIAPEPLDGFDPQEREFFMPLG